MPTGGDGLSAEQEQRSGPGPAIVVLIYSEPVGDETAGLD